MPDAELRYTYCGRETGTDTKTIHICTKRHIVAVLQSTADVTVYIPIVQAVVISHLSQAENLQTQRPSSYLKELEPRQIIVSELNVYNRTINAKLSRAKPNKNEPCQAAPSQVKYTRTSINNRSNAEQSKHGLS